METVFGVRDPLKYDKKKKKYELYCNEGGCTARTFNMTSHLINSPKHKMPKDRAALLNSYKVSFKILFTFVEEQEN